MPLGMVQLSGISSLTPTTVMGFIPPSSVLISNVLPAAFAVPNIFSAVLRLTMAVAPVPHDLLEPEMSLPVKNSMPGLLMFTTGTVMVRLFTLTSVLLTYGQ